MVRTATRRAVAESMVSSHSVSHNSTRGHTVRYLLMQPRRFDCPLDHLGRLLATISAAHTILISLGRRGWLVTTTCTTYLGIETSRRITIPPAYGE